MRPSRLLARLDAAIAAATRPLEADCLRAERAGYRARQGHVGEARQILRSLHQRHDARPNVAISAWLNLADGLVGHCGEAGGGARDKMQRAHALSGAAGLTDVHALSAAWLAHMDYLRADLNAMTRHVGQALRLAATTHHAARSRGNLIVANAYHHAGRIDLARTWYGRAREHASHEGDDATKSALNHSMAGLQTACLRQMAIQGACHADTADRALASVESAAQFDRLWSAPGLNATQVPVLRAQIFTIQGRVAEALGLFETLSCAAASQGMGRSRADLFADQSWCRIRLGQTEAARGDAALAEASIDASGRCDDRGFAHSRLSQVFGELGDADAAGRHGVLAAQAWIGHSDFQIRVVGLLSGMSENGPAA